jgi:hypothetical protein
LGGGVWKGLPDAGLDQRFRLDHRLFNQQRNRGVEHIKFDPTYARYVQMVGIERGTPYGYSLYELEVYKAVRAADFDENGDVDMVDFSILAIDWLKTGSLVSDISGPAGTPDSVVDIYDLMEFANFWLE